MEADSANPDFILTNPLSIPARYPWFQDYQGRSQFHSCGRFPYVEYVLVCLLLLSYCCPIVAGRVAALRMRANYIAECSDWVVKPHFSVRILVTWCNSDIRMLMFGSCGPGFFGKRSGEGEEEEEDDPRRPRRHEGVVYIQPAPPTISLHLLSYLLSCIICPKWVTEYYTPVNHSPTMISLENHGSFLTPKKPLSPENLSGIASRTLPLAVWLLQWF